MVACQLQRKHKGIFSAQGYSDCPYHFKGLIVGTDTYITIEEVGAYAAGNPFYQSFLALSTEEKESLIRKAAMKVNAVDLAEWNNVPENDGSATHYIQVQVRRTSYDDAKNDCRRIVELFDSGTDERVIDLSDDIFCIATPRRGAAILARGEGYTTFYCELALWSNTR